MPPVYEDKLRVHRTRQENKYICPTRGGSVGFYSLRAPLREGDASEESKKKKLKAEGNELRRTAHLTHLTGRSILVKATESEQGEKQKTTENTLCVSDRLRKFLLNAPERAIKRAREKKRREAYGAPHCVIPVKIAAFKLEKQTHSFVKKRGKKEKG